METQCRQHICLFHDLYLGVRWEKGLKLIKIYQNYLYQTAITLKSLLLYGLTWLRKLGSWMSIVMSRTAPAKYQLLLLFLYIIYFIIHAITYITSLKPYINVHTNKHEMCEMMFFVLQRRRVAIRLPRLTVMTSVIFCKLVKDFGLYGDSNPG